ncbi:MAG: mechanosensitive ion channel family protein [Candidatus Eisenbacteria bacterium]|uniref:Mechanosensitive ion channel family protein n=1 Tax=Eiseniibacteriota bacterium TaxID=2212470 RepID=A0A933SHW7_UNCEI|nr:mechanosensitive ion channel family protein [Candidatus Eisenbacteria bacterium]
MISSAFPAWLVPDTEWLADAAVRVALTIVFSWLLQRIGFLVVRRLERWMVRASQGREAAAQRARTLGQMFRHLITTLVAAGALLHVLEVFGWDIKPLLVGASILGAALGFGAQFLVRDVIAGAFILIEDQFSVGDSIEVNGQVGTVEDVTLRSTRLRDITGRLLFVPNGEMKIVVNHSRDWHQAAVDLPIAPNQDLERALALAAEVAAEMNTDPVYGPQLLESLKVLGIERVGPEGATVKLVGRTRPGAAAFELSREARRRLLARLREAGVRVASGAEVEYVSVTRTAPFSEPEA